MTFEEKVARLREFGVGTVKIQDIASGTALAPFRIASLLHNFTTTAEVIETISDWARLAFEVGGMLTLHAGVDHRLDIGFTRPLTSDEIKAVQL